MPTNSYADDLGSAVHDALETTHAIAVCPFQLDLTIRVGDDAADTHAFARARKLVKSDGTKWDREVLRKEFGRNCGGRLTVTILTTRFWATRSYKTVMFGSGQLYTTAAAGGEWPPAGRVQLASAAKALGASRLSPLNLLVRVECAHNRIIPRASTETRSAPIGRLALDRLTATRRGKANYCLNRRDAFTCFLDAGRVRMSNNAAERKLWAVVVGRRNFDCRRLP